MALCVSWCGLLALPAPASATFGHRDDWNHIKATLVALRRATPSVPVVYLLGGSAARECVTTEPAWQTQIAACGGGRVRAFNFGAASQSYAKSIAIVEAMPAAPTVVLIGVNVGRYTTLYPKATSASDVRLSLSSAKARRGVYDSHRFHDGCQLSDSAKRASALSWLSVRYPVFRTRYRGNAAMLKKLIRVCRERGFHPVLVELPLNLAVVGHSWDAARLRYQRDCRAAARAAGIRYVSFIAEVGLVSDDFADVSHLVEPGRTKYQRRLSRVVAAALRRAGIAGWSAADALREALADLSGWLPEAP